MSLFFMTITNTFSCKDSSSVTSSIIDVEINSNSLLNVIILLGPITFLHFVTRMIYIRKVIIAQKYHVRIWLDKK